MKKNIAKIAAINLMLAGVGLIVMGAGAPEVNGVTTVEEPAAVYKAKCAMCHTPKAEKFYDPAKTEEVHVEVVLKGKKGEKPPFMPGYAEKGMTADEAKGLVQYMQALRQPK